MKQLSIIFLCNLFFVQGHLIQNNVCQTEKCQSEANRLLLNMDTTVNPCDNFFEFACGNYTKKPIPEDKVRINAYDEMRDLVQSQMHKAIKAVGDDAIRPFKLLKRLFQTCMDTEKIESRGLQPLKNILGHFKGWPVIEKKWDKNNFNWLETIYEFRKNGLDYNSIFYFDVRIDVKNTSRRIIEIDQGNLGLSREYLVKGKKHKVVKAYYEYMVDVAVTLGAERTNAEKEMKASLEFEMKLANISLSNTVRRNPDMLYNPMSIAEMQQKYPNIPWMEYIHKMLPENVHVTSDYIVINAVPSYLEQLENILNETPKRTIANYLMWKICRSTITYTNKKMRDIQLKFYTASTGQREPETRWKECVRISINKFSIAAGSLFVRNYFDELSKKEVKRMANDIRSVITNNLIALDWMDTETKMKALNKLKEMAENVAYPDELLDDSKLEEFYKKVAVNEDRYLETILNNNFHFVDFSEGRLHEPVNRSDWIIHGSAAVVNAFYMPSLNAIELPAAIFQHIFFSKDRPRYLNYGCIGYTIGHEMFHGFDDRGRRYGADGSLTDWWDDKTKTAFLDKARCIVEQYSNYTLNEMHINGNNSQGENIADNAGMKFAYVAYKKWSEENPTEPSLPGLPYTPLQMFWVSAANKWCTNIRAEALENQILTDSHAPAMFRVIAPMSNNPNFAEDWHCPLGSKMNPKNKCVIW